MASSETQIANLALAKLAMRRVDNLSESTPEARWASELYPHARDFTTEFAMWRHAKCTATLTEEATNDLEDDWGYAYTRPSDCLGLKYLLPQTGAYDPRYPVRFICEGDIIYTDEDAARAVYVKQVTDVTRFSPSFTDAVSWYLAHLLVQPLRTENRYFGETLNGFNNAVAHAVAMSDAEEVMIWNAEESKSEWMRRR